MKCLIYGAGVIGGYLAHVLCAGGHDVAILARGGRAEVLQAQGLVIRHHLQRKTTVDRPAVVRRLDPAEPYDAVFAAMQFGQMRGILDALAAANTGLVVLVGNNLDAEGMATHIQAHSPAPKAVLFGFSGTGGRREGDRIICARFGAAHLTCGPAHGAPTPQVKALLSALFPGPYRPIYMNDMDAWLKCHAAFILPIAHLSYTLDCNLRRASRAQLSLCMDAAAEAYGLLSALGYPILPEGDDAYFRPGPRRAIMAAMLWGMAKTRLGELAATDHCRAAVAEMRLLDQSFEALRHRAPDFSMLCFDQLRQLSPGWDELERRYAPVEPR